MLSRIDCVADEVLAGSQPLLVVGAGAGGGGGQALGGGGQASGGGGGSSFVDSAAGVTASVNTIGGNTGNGNIVITW